MYNEITSYRRLADSLFDLRLTSFLSRLPSFNLFSL